MVMIVRGNKCCGRSDSLGVTFQVTDIRQHAGLCRYCLAHNSGLVADSDRPTVTYLYKLKRIPPLTELEGEKRDEEITA